MDLSDLLTIFIAVVAVVVAIKSSRMQREALQNQANEIKESSLVKVNSMFIDEARKFDNSPEFEFFQFLHTIELYLQIYSTAHVEVVELTNKLALGALNSLSKARCPDDDGKPFAPFLAAQGHKLSAALAEKHDLRIEC